MAKIYFIMADTESHPSVKDVAMTDATSKPAVILNPRKKIKTSELPLSSATRTAIEQLSHRFKKKGGYDAIRKQVWVQLEGSEFEHDLVQRVKHRAIEELERDPTLLSAGRKKSAILIEGALERSDIYQTAEAHIRELLKTQHISAIEEGVRALRVAEVGEEQAALEREKGSKTDGDYAREAAERRAERERIRHEELEKERQLEEEKYRKEKEAREERRRADDERRRQEREADRKRRAAKEQSQAAVVNGEPVRERVSRFDDRGTGGRGGSRGTSRHESCGGRKGSLDDRPVGRGDSRGGRGTSRGNSRGRSGRQRSYTPDIRDAPRAPRLAEALSKEEIERHEHEALEHLLRAETKTSRPRHMAEPEVDEALVPPPRKVTTTSAIKPIDRDPPTRPKRDEPNFRKQGPALAAAHIRNTSQAETKSDDRHKYDKHRERSRDRDFRRGSRDRDRDIRPGRDSRDRRDYKPRSRSKEGRRRDDRYDDRRSSYRDSKYRDSRTDSRTDDREPRKRGPSPPKEPKNIIGPTPIDPARDPVLSAVSGSEQAQIGRRFVNRDAEEKKLIEIRTREAEAKAFLAQRTEAIAKGLPLPRDDSAGRPRFGSSGSLNAPILGSGFSRPRWGPHADEWGERDRKRDVEIAGFGTPPTRLKDFSDRERDTWDVGPSTRPSGDRSGPRSGSTRRDRTPIGPKRESSASIVNSTISTEPREDKDRGDSGVPPVTRDQRGESAEAGEIRPDADIISPTKSTHSTRRRSRSRSKGRRRDDRPSERRDDRGWRRDDKYERDDRNDRDKDRRGDKRLSSRDRDREKRYRPSSRDRDREKRYRQSSRDRRTSDRPRDGPRTYGRR